MATPNPRPPTSFDPVHSARIDALIAALERDDTGRITRAVLRLRKRWAERHVPVWMPANGGHHE